MTKEQLIESYKQVKKYFREDGYHKYWEFDAIDEAIRTLRTAKNPVTVFQKRVQEQEKRQQFYHFAGSYYELQLNLSRECLSHLQVGVEC